MNINYRYANESDARGIAFVAAHSWKETYTGFMSEDYLNNRIKNIDKSSEKVRNILQNTDTYLVAEIDNKIVGICHYNKSERENYKDYGLLGALYLLKDYQGLGIGKEMFKIAIKGLIDMGYNDMYLECLKGNETLEFYKHFGGEVVETIDYQIKDFSVKADILVFNNLYEILEKFEKNKGGNGYGI